ncbi:MAG: ABC transporter ATP-binding protein, partial [Planctomycetota bacterium]
FGIHRGETFVMLGLSGTGKSVRLKHMIGLLFPDYGRVLINGVDTSRLSPKEQLESKKQFGYLFQSGALINWMTIAENVALPLREHTHLPEEEIQRRVLEKLAMVNLEEHGHKFPSDISGGMKKRAGLARAIVRDPEILLYDEPTSGLDPVMSRGVDRMIVKLQRELGVTSILVTHDMESAYLCADRIAMLYQGRVQQIGTSEEIRRTRDPIVKAFVTGGELPDVTDTSTPPVAVPPPGRGTMHRIKPPPPTATDGETGDAATGA